MRLAFPSQVRLLTPFARVHLLYSLGNFDPFMDENPSQAAAAVDDDSRTLVNLPSLDAVHDLVHQSSENESVSNGSQSHEAGPSLDMIDFHPHDHDDSNSSVIESARRFIIQPSLDLLDAQLHDGDEHVHEKRNHTNEQAEEAAANFGDYQRWLKEQNETNQLDRFLLLQKEVKNFRLDKSPDLTEKLNRTIEELKLAARDKLRARHEL